MSRYKPFSRRILKGRFTTWLAGHKQMVAVIVLGALALLAFETVIILNVFHGPFRWYLLGLTHAGLCAALAHLLHTSFLAHDRQAILQMRGAWGEENTRSELARARRKRLIWGWVDSLTFQYADVDHLVITRAGGLVAIDSKWRTETDAADIERMARDAHKTRMRAEAVMRTVLDRERGSHRDRTSTHRVTPLLVIWGPVQHTMPAGASYDGVQVVAGRQLINWLEAHRGDPVERQAARDLRERLEAFRAAVWDATRQEQVPRATATGNYHAREPR